ncbi:centromere protein T isoform X2 [Anarrhichthys ocellatus]|uniref:centromere protein T isoform X2 n=1 Tax=Anarrhichthys ocellatus TaxID=433405 RepID=UPI0012EDD9DD|nr:centromere protein T-like isoform X2 [Anarrhichthys ocellatus]
MDPTEDLSARVLLKHILSTETPRTPITRSSSNAQTTSVTRSSKRQSKKDAGPQTPQDFLRRSLRHKIRESITRQSLPSAHKRAASVGLRKMNTPAPTSLLFDDGETPRHMLMNILRTEPVKSPVVHEKGASEEPQPSSADSSITRKCPSIELSGLDLPDITIGNAASTAKGLSRKRPRRSLNVTAFEKRLKDGEDDEEESEESIGDHSSLSLSSSTSLSLKTPFVDVRTEKRVLLRRISNRRKITVEEFGAAVNKRQMGGVSSFVQGERGLSETADSEGFTLGLSKLGEPDITTDILHCNTALYAQPDAMTSSFSIIATQDKPTAMVSQLQRQMEQEELMEAEHSNLGKEKSIYAFPTEEGAQPQNEEEQDIAESQSSVKDDTTESEEEENRVEAETGGGDYQTKEQGAADSHTEEDVATGSQSEEEEAAADSQTEEEVAVVFQTEDEGAGESQTEEEGGVDSQTEEEHGGVDSRHEEDIAARSQSEEEEAAADSQTDEDGAVESQTEEEQRAVDSHTEEDVASRSQSEEEEAAADSQTEEEVAVDSQTEEEQGVVDSQHEEDVEARSQSEEEDFAPDSQKEEGEEEDAVDSQIEEDGAVDLQSVEDVVEYQSDQEDPAANSLPEDEHAGRPEEEDDEASEQLEPDLGHISRRAHRSEGGLTMPVIVAGGDTEAGWSDGKSKAHSSLDMGSHESGPLHVGVTDLPESSTQRWTNATYTEVDADKENSFNLPEVTHDIEDGGHLNVDSPEEAAAQDPAEQVEEEEEDDEEDEEDDEDSDEIPSKTPAFVKQKIHFFQRNALASPSVFKNIQASSTGEGPSAKQKQVRKRRKGPAKKETDLPKSYLMGVFKHFAKTNVSADVYPVLKEIMDKYFDRLAEDLETYAGHAKRKTIEFEDAELLLKRQGYVNDKVPVEVLIEKYLRMDQRKLLIPIATSGNVVIPKKRR